jgi:hypothetical protein
MAGIDLSVTGRSSDYFGRRNPSAAFKVPISVAREIM